MADEQVQQQPQADIGADAAQLGKADIMDVLELGEGQQAPQDGAGAAGTGAGAGTGTGANTGADAGTGSGAGGAAAVEEPAALTRDDIVAILREAGLGEPAAATRTQPAAQQPQWTQEDYERAFNVYKPDAALLTMLRDEDPNKALQALLAYRDGLVKQVMTMADYRIQQVRDQLVKDHIEPVQSYVSEQQATSFRNDFFKAYPDLERYEVIVDAVSSKLHRDGWQGKNRKEVMDRFAQDTKAVVSTLTKGNGNGGNAGTSAQGNGQTAQRGGRRMSTLSGGGQGGQSRPAANAGSVAPNLPKNIAEGLSVFD